MANFSKYIQIAYYLNGLVDDGESITVDEVKKLIRSNGIFHWLKSTYGDRIDISLLTEEDKTEISNLFKSLADYVDESRKFCVKENGFCLLVAYCLQAAQDEYGEATKKRGPTVHFTPFN
jgi:hypothetical protein